MNLFNRIAMISLSGTMLLLSLVFIDGSAGILSLSMRLVEAIQNAPSEVRQLGSAGLGAAAALLLLLEAWPHRSGEVLAIQTGDGMVTYPSGEVSSIVEKELLLNVEGVHDAHALVKGREREVDLFLRLGADSAYDLPDVANRAITRARQKIQSGLGLNLRRTTVSIKRYQPGRAPAERAGQGAA